MLSENRICEETTNPSVWHLPFQCSLYMILRTNLHVTKSLIQFLICWQIFLWGRDCTEWGRRWGCGWKPHVRGHITGQSPLRTGQQTHVQLPVDRYTSASDAWENESLQCNWLTCPLFDLKNENKKKITVQCSKKPSPTFIFFIPRPPWIRS